MRSPEPEIKDLIYIRSTGMMVSRIQPITESDIDSYKESTTDSAGCIAYRSNTAM